MNDTEGTKLTRGKIGLRLLYTLLYLIILEVLKVVVQVTVLFQFVYLLITQKYSEPLKEFSNKVATYAYRIIRYATLNENEKPFPFHEFPKEVEKPDDQVLFD
ncbi:DUF4389 domain-containing protein [Syntrophobacter fumaroxidans]|uniref:Glucose-1-phosphate thymidylyltransferase, long form n=1 Tax=Syntrophobacter fumaroxidans (strain DSM 10017 / MPOB) TaxID=335543 RepID=A0LKA0_SYNFM|nr:DUF4389 domain-containing protein [Syntrophobacter fumaroxidans]ABK17852.1 glucose-1-phosphate thymidylyltransferase, long form [Syntrophobacter fumaroxidans MPOB]HOI96748.1 DUF4389 domain-containing protein [Syntrophobacter fumaroxidans]